MADSSKSNSTSGSEGHSKDLNNGDSQKENKLCLRHAAENISLKSEHENSDESLCKNCSKSMLSYIYLIQDMLNSLARKIYYGEDSSCCSQCQSPKSLSPEKNLSERSSLSEASRDENDFSLSEISNYECGMPPLGENAVPEQKTETNITETLHNEYGKIFNQISYLKTENSSTETSKNENEEHRQKGDSKEILSTSGSSDAIAVPKKQRKVSSRRNSRRLSRGSMSGIPECYVDRNNWQMSFLYNVSPMIESKFPSYVEQNVAESNSENLINVSPNATDLSKDNSANYKESEFEKHEAPNNQNFSSTIKSKEPSPFISSPSPIISSPTNSNPIKFTEESSSKHEEQKIHSEANDSEQNRIKVAEPNSEFGLKTSEIEINENVLTNLTTEGEESSKAKNQNVETSRTLHNCFGKNTSEQDGNKSSSEAFVTICRNNAEALGCLVLGSSLLLSRTAKKLCVIMFDGVDAGFINYLSSVFHVVEHVRHLNSVKVNLDYLNEMKLEKLNIWRLVQYSKCVYLNPDCLVLRNCDELFQRDELSAVPDIGWPDCFNSGVFVFMPSISTFSKLVELSQKQEQNNGGDQILLNTYFDSWSSDISKKLSFIYNMMGNTSYSYAPAFQRFGQNVKIVQFLGTSKPWQVTFFTHSNQIHESEDIHPMHSRFISEWINVFKTAVLRLLPQEIYYHVFCQKILSAEGVVTLFRSPFGCNDFNRNTTNQSNTDQNYQFTSQHDKTVGIDTNNNTRHNSSEEAPVNKSAVQILQQTIQQLVSVTNNFATRDEEEGNEATKSIDNDSPISNVLPGASIGDYQGMKAWEQGHMDYEGSANSENIMKRLSFLIHQTV